MDKSCGCKCICNFKTVDNVDKNVDNLRNTFFIKSEIKILIKKNKKNLLTLF
ncbi:hypothetical protein ANS015_31950 [Paraclostridium bifermentans]|nr:hypothetical protein ANS015_31950 [Paraclostridium bifermentans]